MNDEFRPPWLNSSKLAQGQTLNLHQARVSQLAAIGHSRLLEFPGIQGIF
jgi:hypothetical protein